MLRSFFLKDPALGTEAFPHKAAAVNVATGRNLSAGLKFSVPAMLAASTTSAIFGTTAGVAASVGLGVGMSLVHNVFNHSKRAQP